MSNNLKVPIVIVALLTGTLPVVAKENQPPQPDSVAPIPAQIRTAKRIFISNLGQDCVPVAEDGLPGGAARAYNEFYAAMEQWGRYEIVGSPADADLDFEIGFTCPPLATQVINGDSVGPSLDPRFRLAILDVKTHILLWSEIEHLKQPRYGFSFASAIFITGGRKKAVEALEESYNAALAQLASDLKVLTAKPALSAP
jgi:hypothetical protein